MIAINFAVNERGILRMIKPVPDDCWHANCTPFYDSRVGPVRTTQHSGPDLVGPFLFRRQRQLGYPHYCDDGELALHWRHVLHNLVGNSRGAGHAGDRHDGPGIRSVSHGRSLELDRMHRGIRRSGAASVSYPSRERICRSLLTIMILKGRSFPIRPIAAHHATSWNFDTNDKQYWRLARRIDGENQWFVTHSD